MYRPDRLSPPLESVREEEKARDVFSLESLIAWLETKPARATYCWVETGTCLFSQYGEAMGLGNGSSTAYDAVVSGFMRNPSIRFRWSVACEKPHTFGAALSRTRQQMARS